jgi:hypothetical protein
VKDTQILKMIPKNWSDHAAVVLTIHEQPALHPHPSPSISSRNMSRFQEDRWQKKLTSLFSRGASKPMTTSKVDVTPNKKGSQEQGVVSTVPLAEEDLIPGDKIAAMEKLDQSPEQAEEPVSLCSESPLAANNDQNPTDTAVEAAENSGEEPINVKILDGTPTLKDDTIGLEELQSETLDIDAKHIEENVEVEAPDLQKDISLEVPKLGPESNVSAVADMQRSSPNKRKGTESAGVAAKQRNLSSYFKVAARNNAGNADEQSR